MVRHLTVYYYYFVLLFLFYIFLFLCMQPLASNLWNGENKKYVVQWKLHSSPNYTSSYTSIDETTTTYRLTGLLKWRDYDVQVASSNNIGFSNFSTVVTAKTLESGQFATSVISHSLFLVPFHSSVDLIFALIVIITFIVIHVLPS